jgi:hypothetical protein
MSDSRQFLIEDLVRYSKCVIFIRWRFTLLSLLLPNIILKFSNYLYGYLIVFKETVHFSLLELRN